MKELPEGHVASTGMLYGLLGPVVAFTLNQLGFLRGGDHFVQQLVVDHVTLGEPLSFLSMGVAVILTMCFCLALAFALLDSRDSWRRVLLSLFTLVIMIAMVPTCALWSVYFSPLIPVVGVVWTSFCVVFYASHHRMPCDRVGSHLSGKEEVSCG